MEMFTCKKCGKEDSNLIPKGNYFYCQKCSFESDIRWLGNEIETMEGWLRDKGWVKRNKKGGVDCIKKRIKRYKLRRDEYRIDLNRNLYDKVSQVKEKISDLVREKNKIKIILNISNIIKELLEDRVKFLACMYKLNPKHYVYIGEELTRKRDYDKLHGLMIENFRRTYKILDKLTIEIQKEVQN